MTTYNILIVEDEFIPANYLKKILTQSGHRVLGIAESKRSALNYIHSQTIPDLILMDIMLKGDKDGIDVAKTIQLHTRSAVLFISAYSDASFLDRAIGTNSIGYLVKPITADTLLSTIEIGMAHYLKEQSNTIIPLCDDVIFDTVEKNIRQGRKITDLPQHEAIVLDTLIKGKNTIISTEHLELILDEDEPISKGALRTVIWRLRKKLPLCVSIDNIYGSGYKISF